MMKLKTPLLGLAIAGSLALAACGSDSPSTSAATTVDAAMEAKAMEEKAMAEKKDAFCAKATELGSLSKGTSEAMAMAPADSAKDFQALADKVLAMKASAPTELQADIDTVAARLGLEVMLETDKAAGTSVDDVMAKLDGQKADDEAAVGRVVTAVQTDCNVNIG